ncbi:hypothetical protein [Actinomadura miaoliensis]|uniref:WD40 repeat domain-containing protein n=1 Tax=Actinomadura miaoliensis TaxID=430685 RepID=UPI0031E7D64A
MDVLPCGHVAYAGERRLCRHLVGERADDHDKVWVLRGVGVEYDLCCADCGQDDGQPELIVACEGCVDRADDDAVVAVVGEPEVRRRPEPVDGSVDVRRLPFAPLDVAPVADRAGEWLLLDGSRLVRWNADTGEVVGTCDVRLPDMDSRRTPRDAPRYRLHASPDGAYAAVVVDFGRYGTVVETSTGRTPMRLDRGHYHVEQTPFPAAFTRVDGQVLLAHGSGWNRVDLSDPATGENVTPREFEPPGKKRTPHYLDYFYGTLCPSPDGRWMASDGWVWAPVGLPRLWDAHAWRHENVYESEDGASVRDLRLVPYNWNVPMCWLDESRFAISGIGRDDQAMIPGVEIFSAESGTRIARFAGPEGRLHADGRRLYSSDPDSLRIWDHKTGELTGEVPGFVPTHHHPADNRLAELDADLLRLWRAG